MWYLLLYIYIGLGKRPLVWDQESGSNPVVSFQGGVLTHWCLVLRRQDKLPRWFESTWGMGYVIVIEIVIVIVILIEIVIVIMWWLVDLIESERGSIHGRYILA